MNASATLRMREFRMRTGSLQLDLDADFHGSVTGIFGPSGSGKTTILEAIAGLRPPESGRIEVAGIVLTDTSRGLQIRAEHRRIGYVPQDLALFPHLSVRQNILFGVRKPEAGAISLAHIVEVLEIQDLLSRDVVNLSGGEKQRVAFARALLAEPRLLLLDEPFSSLDLELRARMSRYLLRVRDEFRIPMIYVSHNPDELGQLCEEVVVLGDGKLIRRGAPEEVFERAEEPRYTYRNRKGSTAEQ